MSLNYYLFKILYFFGKKQYLSKYWWVFYYLDFWRKKIVYKNLNIAFPHKSKKEKIEIAKNTYKSFLHFFEDIIKYNDNPNSIKIEIKNKTIIEKVLNTNKPIIFMTAHFGNWEILPKHIYYKYKKPIAIIAREIEDPKINSFFKNIRSNDNIKIINKKKGAKEIINSIKKEKRIIGILIDHYTKNKNAPTVNFFKKTKFNPAISKLAKSLNTIVIPTFIYWDKDKYIIEFKEPKSFENTNIQQFTQWQATVIEKMIKKYPEQYYWFHNRWKN